jgi:hypothetical protein
MRVASVMRTSRCSFRLRGELLQPRWSRLFGPVMTSTGWCICAIRYGPPAPALDEPLEHSLGEVKRRNLQRL